MSQDVHVSNRGGKRINPAEEFRLPVAASGQVKDLTAINTDYTLTVVAEARYWVQAIGSGITYLGVAAVATGAAYTAANILWTIPANEQIGIEIPAGVTTLHIATTNAGDDVRISRATY